MSKTMTRTELDLDLKVLRFWWENTKNKNVKKALENIMYYVIVNYHRDNMFE